MKNVAVKMVENDKALLCKRGLTLSCHYVFIDNTSSLLVMQASMSRQCLHCSGFDKFSKNNPLVAENVAPEVTLPAASKYFPSIPWPLRRGGLSFRRVRLNCFRRMLNYIVLLKCLSLLYTLTLSTDLHI